MFQAICDTAFVWKQEMKQVFHDEGVLMFMLIVPLAYPLLYSWIYNNEAVHEVPVVVVDQSHSALSRQFIRDCDATPDVKVLFHADDLDEAQSLVSRQLVKGVYLIPIGKYRQQRINLDLLGGQIEKPLRHCVASE